MTDRTDRIILEKDTAFDIILATVAAVSMARNPYGIILSFEEMRNLTNKVIKEMENKMKTKKKLVKKKTTKKKTK